MKNENWLYLKFEWTLLSNLFYCNWLTYCGLLSLKFFFFFWYFGFQFKLATHFNWHSFVAFKWNCVRDLWMNLNGKRKVRILFFWNLIHLPVSSQIVLHTIMIWILPNFLLHRHMHTKLLSCPPWLSVK